MRLAPMRFALRLSRPLATSPTARRDTIAVVAVLATMALACGCGGSSPSKAHGTGAGKSGTTRPSPVSSSRSAIAACMFSGETADYKDGAVTLYDPHTGASLEKRAAGVDDLNGTTADGASFTPSSRDGYEDGSVPRCEDLSYDGSLTRVAGVVTQDDANTRDGRDTAPAFLDLNSGEVTAGDFVNGGGDSGYSRASSQKVALAAAFDPRNVGLWYLEAESSSDAQSTTHATLYGPGFAATYKVPSYVAHGGDAFDFQFPSDGGKPTVWIPAVDQSAPCCGGGSYFALRPDGRVTENDSVPDEPMFISHPKLPHSNYTASAVRLSDNREATAFVASKRSSDDTLDFSLWHAGSDGSHPTKLDSIPIAVDNLLLPPRLDVIRYGRVTSADSEGPRLSYPSSPTLGGASGTNDGAQEDVSCDAAYPHQAQKTTKIIGGRRTFHNADSSRALVCTGAFGAPEGLKLSPAAKCDIIAASYGLVDPKQGPLADAGCAAVAARSEGLKSSAKGVVCGYLADTLGVGAGLFAAGVTRNPAVGVRTYKGVAFFGETTVCIGAGDGVYETWGKQHEADHEVRVARDVIDRGKCLRWEQRRVVGASWRAVQCSAYPR